MCHIEHARLRLGETFLGARLIRGVRFGPRRAGFAKGVCFLATGDAEARGSLPAVTAVAPARGTKPGFGFFLMRSKRLGGSASMSSGGGGG